MLEIESRTSHKKPDQMMARPFANKINYNEKNGFENDIKQLGP